MRHVPHLHVSRPWDEVPVVVSLATRDHLATVLRMAPGADVSYTDGHGTVGVGVWTGSGVERGTERSVPRGVRSLTMGVAPPRAKERQRIIVEKLQELGVRKLVWLSTARAQVRGPKPERARSWAIGALEQSRGAWLMAVTSSSYVDFVADTERTTVVLDPDAPRSFAWPGGADLAIAVGPEGGFTEEERADRTLATVGSTILRTDTAAVVAAGIALVGAGDAGMGTRSELA